MWDFILYFNPPPQKINNQKLHHPPPSPFKLPREVIPQSRRNPRVTFLQPRLFTSITDAPARDKKQSRATLNSTKQSRESATTSKEYTELIARVPSVVHKPVGSPASSIRFVSLFCVARGHLSFIYALTNFCNKCADPVTIDSRTSIDIKDNNNICLGRVALSLCLPPRSALNGFVGKSSKMLSFPIHPPPALQREERRQVATSHLDRLRLI